MYQGTGGFTSFKLALPTSGLRVSSQLGAMPTRGSMLSEFLLHRARSRVNIPGGKTFHPGGGGGSHPLIQPYRGDKEERTDDNRVIGQGPDLNPLTLSNPDFDATLSQQELDA
jgi:hypothetical protein